MQEVYLYDGSFYGLLTIVFHCYISHHLPDFIYEISSYQANLLETATYLPTEEDKADRIFHGIVTSISYHTLYYIYQAFLSTAKNKELAIVKYLLHGFSIGPKINTMLSLDYVWKVQTASKTMFGEAHRLKGLLRFQEIGPNLFYASIHPDNNVIETIGHHFMRRLPTQNFIIHDKNRNLIFLYRDKEYQIFTAKNLNLPAITKEEENYQKLWKVFFNTIAIKERKNAKLQMQFMPKKYWQDLVEMQ